MRKFVEPDVADNPLYHDTWKLLKKYRDVVWSLELSVQHVRTKFEIEYGTAEFISARTGLASVAVSSKSKQLGTWRISNYTPEFRETSGVGKRPVLTPDEVLRLPLDQALIIIRGKKVLQVDKMDYSKHPEAKYLRSCKASAHVPEWRRLEEEAAKTPQPAPKPAPAAKKPAKRKATKPASPTDKSPKEAPAPKSAGTPEGIITTDKDSILS